MNIITQLRYSLIDDPVAFDICDYVTTQMLVLKPIISGIVEHLFNIFFSPVVFYYFPGMCSMSGALVCPGLWQRAVTMMRPNRKAA